MIFKVSEKEPIKTPSQIAEILNKILSQEERYDQDKEHFYTIGLNARNIICYIELVSLGTLNANLSHPREIFRLAVRKGVASIMVAHNHPSNDSRPSSDDVEITKQLIEAGKILGIDMIDHIILTTDGYLSFREKGLLT